MIETPVFVDFEASGLGPDCYPIEVGWAFVAASRDGTSRDGTTSYRKSGDGTPRNETSGGGDVVVGDSMLIRPPEEWRGPAGLGGPEGLGRPGSWDSNAEKLHGITLSHLMKHGRDPMDVARRMNAVLAGRVLYSDSPFDRAWLRALFEETNERMAFEMAVKGADTLIVELADRLGTGDLDYTAAEREAERLAPRTHRAAADAAYWATLWKLVLDGYRAEPGARPELGGVRMKP